jgi:hypothetical protein
VTVTVMDSQSPAAHTTSPIYTITVVDPNALAITSGNPPPSGLAGFAYNRRLCGLGNGTYTPCGGFALTATGGLPPYIWSWAAAPGSSTPPGMHIAQNFTQCLPYGGTPYVAWQICGISTKGGTYSVLVTVADSSSPPNQVSGSYTINIQGPSQPIITTTTIPESAVNLPYSFKFAALGVVAPLTWSETGALPPGLSLAADGTLSGTPAVTGSFPINVMVSDSVGLTSSPQNFTVAVADHGFKLTGSMAASRVAHSATLLQDGKVLIVGGISNPSFGGPPLYPYSYNEPLTAEQYDPVTRTFSPAGYDGGARYCHTATLLSDGRVLIAGGFGDTNPDNPAALATAEIFDPASGTFTATGNMTIARGCHTATLLANGKVLIAGGAIYVYDRGPVNSAELFDPETGAFSSTGPMGTARATHTATLLQDGRVLVTGGSDGANSFATAELYDPSTGQFSSAGDMATARAWQTATLLNTGEVLIAGGMDVTNGSSIASAEIFDPTSGAFSTTGSMANARSRHTATLLNDGTVLVVGGTPAFVSAELFDLTTGTFSDTGSLAISRAAHTANLLSDGTVLVTGGTDGGGLDIAIVMGGIAASAELYQ